MRHPHRVFMCFAFLLVNGPVFAGADLQNIPLKWTPTSTVASMGTVDLSGNIVATPIHVDTLVDTRENPALVAENREKVGKFRQVTTSTNVAAFVTDHLKESLHSAGLNIVDGPADITVSGEIRQFFVTEMSTYKGEISILIRVKNGAGKELWTGAVGGDAERFGRSYNDENYYETISDMVLRASYHLLANSGFRETLKAH
ncbi:MAG: YajG family lipoprotein [Steroidobacteraceae bacterium]